MQLFDRWSDVKRDESGNNERDLELGKMKKEGEKYDAKSRTMQKFMELSFWMNFSFIHILFVFHLVFRGLQTLFYMSHVLDEWEDI